MTKGIFDARGEAIRRSFRLSVEARESRVFLNFGVPMEFVGLEVAPALRLAEAIREEAKKLLGTEPPPNTPPMWLVPLLHEVLAYVEEGLMYFGEDDKEGKVLWTKIDRLLRPEAVPEGETGRGLNPG